MFVKFEGRILNISQIQFIEKFNRGNGLISIHIHFLSKETLEICYVNVINRNTAYDKLEGLLINNTYKK